MDVASVDNRSRQVTAKSRITSYEQVLAVEQPMIYENYAPFCNEGVYLRLRELLDGSALERLRLGVK